MDSNSVQNDNLIVQENSRLSTEKAKSESDFQQLNSENEKTKINASERKKSGKKLSNESINMKVQRTAQEQQLKNRKNELEASLQSNNQKIKSAFEENVQATFAAIQKQVQQETRQLSSALEALQQSNQRIIQNLRQCLEKMPQAIFEPEKDWCPETQNLRRLSQP